MANNSDADVRALLRDGWVVVGYSTTFMPAVAALVHSVLLQRNDELLTVNVYRGANNKEVGRLRYSL